jgi:hypothetical protein
VPRPARPMPVAGKVDHAAGRQPAAVLRGREQLQRDRSTTWRCAQWVATQSAYVRHVRAFAPFLKRWPDTATPRICGVSSCTSANIVSGSPSSAPRHHLGPGTAEPRLTQMEQRRRERCLREQERSRGGASLERQPVSNGSATKRRLGKSPRAVQSSIMARSPGTLPQRGRIQSNVVRSKLAIISRHRSAGRSPP